MDENGVRGIKRSKLSLKKASMVCISRKSSTTKLEATGFSVIKRVETDHRIPSP